MNYRLACSLLTLALLPASAPAQAAAASTRHADSTSRPEIPDAEVAAAYERAAVQNVLAAVNPKVFPGYWSVCADGQGFGYGNTYPSLDGHQMTDALLWLGQVEVVKANWDYVRSFQRPNGLLPLAIFPAKAAKKAGPGKPPADPNNGGLYQHWVPGNPLAALAGPTYIQNADVIYRHTLDRPWLAAQIKSVNLAADHLASLVTEQGRVKGAGYYVERPTRMESDGVAQCYAVDAFRRTAALNRVLGDGARARRYDDLAERIQKNFVAQFWVKNHFAEYLHPQRGLIASHGLTDVDWAALATGIATPEQRAILWPQLKNEARFHYGGMPTGIATRPETYEPWEFSHPDRHDLAAMGRVWYLEAWARAQMGDAQGLLDGIRKVCRVGRAGGYFWRERYYPDGKGGMIPAGAQKYCEYPSNLIRIVQRFLLGVDLRLDGSLVLAPTATEEFWERGFGQTMAWGNRKVSYHMQRNRTAGTYAGTTPLRLGLRFPRNAAPMPVRVLIDGRSVEPVREKDLIYLTLPAASQREPCRFEIACRTAESPASDHEHAAPPLAFDVKLDVVKQELHPDFCWFHPRVAAIPGAGREGQPAVIMTLQKHLAASDHYSGLWTMRTDDLGKTWTGPTEIRELAWTTEPGGVVTAVADVTPGWHPQTGKLIAMGCTVRYGKSGEQLSDVRRFSQTAYAVLDPKTGRWSKWQVLELPGEDKFNMARNACAQWLVLPDRTLLVPIYFAKAPNVPASVTVLHCAFDGRKLTYLKHGDELSLGVVRGLCEPSIIAFRDRFYLTIRNDVKGYVTVSNDGLHYQPIKPWTFDDGSELGSYNTQQHWLAHQEGLFLAYTRRGASNDHIPRNRAPVFLAQVDPGRLCVIHKTERAIIPERGAMLGNFGASVIDAGQSWVTVAEYVAKGQASPRGANGSVFAARVVWSKPNDLAPRKAK